MFFELLGLLFIYSLFFIVLHNIRTGLLCLSEMVRSVSHLCGLSDMKSSPKFIGIVTSHDILVELFKIFQSSPSFTCRLTWCFRYGREKFPTVVLGLSTTVL